ncbi:hypothetical protein C3L33_18745, partial [Rhododendron williamsianum]
MDTQTASPPTPPPAPVIGNAFVEQYYHILHYSPELVHRFYQESSILSRPEPNGVMTSVTTTELIYDNSCDNSLHFLTMEQGINDKICSFDYKNYKAEIKTADAQESYKDGVIVLVTGCLTGMDDIRRKFTQTFFLAPQDKGYFVLNDVFRYVEDSEPLESNKVIVNGIHDAPLASITPDPEPVYDPPEVDSTTSLIEEVQVQHVEEKPCDPVDNERQLVDEEEVVVEHEPQSDENHVLAVTESASYTAQEDAPKKSYAYILSSQTKKAGSGPAKVYVQANTSRVGPTKTEKQTPIPVAHDPVTEPSAPSASGSVNDPQSGNAQEEESGEDFIFSHPHLVYNLGRLSQSMMLLVTSHKVRNKAGASSCSDVVGLDCQSFCNLLFGPSEREVGDLRPGCEDDLEVGTTGFEFDIPLDLNNYCSALLKRVNILDVIILALDAWTISCRLKLADIAFDTDVMDHDASPITVGDKQAVVEIKRTTTRGKTLDHCGPVTHRKKQDDRMLLALQKRPPSVGSGRERFSSGRGGFRSDSFRGRRNFVGGRGYGRSEVGNLGGDFSGRGRGPGGRSGDGNQQGRGRGGRRGVSNWNPISA